MSPPVHRSPRRSAPSIVLSLLLIGSSVPVGIVFLASGRLEISFLAMPVIALVVYACIRPLMSKKD